MPRAYGNPSTFGFGFSFVFENSTPPSKKKQRKEKKTMQRKGRKKERKRKAAAKGRAASSHARVRVNVSEFNFILLRRVLSPCALRVGNGTRCARVACGLSCACSVSVIPACNVSEITLRLRA